MHVHGTDTLFSKSGRPDAAVLVRAVAATNAHALCALCAIVRIYTAIHQTSAQKPQASKDFECTQSDIKSSPAPNWAVAHIQILKICKISPSWGQRP